MYMSSKRILKSLLTGMLNKSIIHNNKGGDREHERII
jgi:hypothetical protein